MFGDCPTCKSEVKVSRLVENLYYGLCFTCKEGFVLNENEIRPSHSEGFLLSQDSLDTFLSNELIVKTVKKNIGNRIAIIGTTGSGKTTVARTLSKILNYPNIELDALFWEKNWKKVSDQIFRERVINAIKLDKWIIDGNYEPIRNLIWERADTVIYLDYTILRTFFQLLLRTTSRLIRNDELWSGNRENFKSAFFSRKSIIWWMIQTYYSRQKHYTNLFQQPKYAYLSVIHLKNPYNTEKWLSSLIRYTEDK